MPSTASCRMGGFAFAMGADSSGCTVYDKGWGVNRVDATVHDRHHDANEQPLSGVHVPAHLAATQTLSFKAEVSACGTWCQRASASGSCGTGAHMNPTQQISLIG